MDNPSVESPQPQAQVTIGSTPIPTTPSAGKKNWGKILLISVLCIIVIPIILLIIYFNIATRLFTPYKVAGTSMEPRYKAGQIHLVDRLSFRNADPQRFDVVMLRNPFRTGAIIKRVIGIPGDSLVMNNDGSLSLNNQVLDESAYLAPGVGTYPGQKYQQGEVISVPQNMYFVLGDNRVYSADSREAGLIPKNDIYGKVVQCILSCSK